MPTIKEIALLAGVSRGTVDRVLNNRGSVDPKKAKKVLEIARALEYTPNLAGKTLAAKKKQLKFGYILFGSTSSNPFFEDVVRAIKNRADEMAGIGVTVEIRFVTIDKPELQAACIDELVAEGIDGLAITPINHPLVAEKLKALADSGFPVITANTDIPDCGRLAYVGSDYYKSGETAAGLMNLITCGKANIGIIIGSPLVLCHSERLAGFTHYVEKAFAGLKVLAKAVNNDDDIDSYRVTRDMLDNNPEIDSLFLAAAGVLGACRAVKDLGLAGKLAIVCFDVVPSTRDLILEGVISAAIGQQPARQGAQPLDLLFDRLGMGVMPEKEFYYTETEIKIRENL